MLQQSSKAVVFTFPSESGFMLVSWLYETRREELPLAERLQSSCALLYPTEYIARETEPVFQLT